MMKGQRLLSFFSIQYSVFRFQPEMGFAHTHFIKIIVKYNKVWTKSTNKLKTEYC